jgi:hypothetical protein
VTATAGGLDPRRTRAVWTLLDTEHIDVTRLSDAAEKLALECFVAHHGTFIRRRVVASASQNFRMPIDDDTRRLLADLYGLGIDQVGSGGCDRPYEPADEDLVKRARNLRVAVIEYIEDGPLLTAVLNIIVEADAVSGVVLEVLGNLWWQFGGRHPSETLGQMVDAYVAAATA